MVGESFRASISRASKIERSRVRWARQCRSWLVSVRLLKPQGRQGEPCRASRRVRKDRNGSTRRSLLWRRPVTVQFADRADRGESTYGSSVKRGRAMLSSVLGAPGIASVGLILLFRRQDRRVDGPPIVARETVEGKPSARFFSITTTGFPHCRDKARPFGRGPLGMVGLQVTPWLLVVGSTASRTSKRAEAFALLSL